MRQKDTINAFEHLLGAYSSGLAIEDYIKSGLKGDIIVKSENESNVASSDDESFSDAHEIVTKETRVAVATIHCEPDCWQCKEAAVTAVTETITFTRVASATGETTAAEVPKRPPVCKFLWRAEVCTVEGCQKSHPTPCNTLSSCLELDQNLPRWKSTGCQKWHGRTKSLSPKPRKPKKSNGKQKSRAFHGSHPQTMGRPWPQTRPQPWLQNLDEPTPHSPLEIDQWNQLRQMGNGQAAQTPLSGSGNNQWGNGMMPYNMAVKGPNPVIPNQLERAYMALVLNRVLA